MAAARATKARAPRRHWPLWEKRRIVELTLPTGASVVEIARTYALHPNIVHQWRRLYRAGKLEARSAPEPQSDIAAVSARFIPVRVIPAASQSLAAVQRDAPACCSSVLHVMLASGSALRIESAAIDATLVCAIVAELHNNYRLVFQIRRELGACRHTRDEFVLNAVDRALGIAKPLIWNSDQGNHFTNPHKAGGGAIRRSRRARPSMPEGAETPYLPGSFPLAPKR